MIFYPWISLASTGIGDRWTICNNYVRLSNFFRWSVELVHELITSDGSVADSKNALISMAVNSYGVICGDPSQTSEIESLPCTSWLS